MDLVEAQRRIDAIEWYHEFDFPNGLQARSKENPEAHRFLWTFMERELDHAEFNGKTVLDIGCWDGYWSFYAERRGARRVLATDDQSQNWAGGRGLALARELFGSQIETRLDVSIYQLDVLGEVFDIILCMGIYYHLIDPFYAFCQIRHRCHPNTLVFVEGDVSENIPEDAVIFNPTNHSRPIFLPSISALNKTLKASYLEVVSQARMVHHAPELPAPPPRPPRRWWERSREPEPVPQPPPDPLKQNRLMTVCRPFVGANELHRYRPPFGLHAYDDRFKKMD
jgi:tRNA (mo5U34)-methyltransferase